MFVMLMPEIQEAIACADAMFFILLRTSPPSLDSGAGHSGDTLGWALQGDSRADTLGWAL